MRKRYDNLDGLRVISCLGIIAMHIKANADYQIYGWIFEVFVPSLTLLVYLFLLISGFGMFCGYYERFKEGKIDLNNFYKKRYKKIIPFFAFLIFIDILVERSFSHLIEGFTEATLVFGLLPNNQPDVIGVSWTIGVIFLFYMLFPFFVWLCWDKKRAFISFIISVILNIFCEIYYFTDKFVIDSFAPRHSFLYCSPFFLGGGLIYMYRKEIKDFVSQRKLFCLLGCLGITGFHYLFIQPWFKMDNLGSLLLLLYLPWLCYAISVDSIVLSNKAMKYFSKISLELYLAHMVLFRVVEKMNFLYFFGKGWLSFILVFVAVLIGLILLIEFLKKMTSFSRRLLIKE
ncbi:TPA: acyltransferase family protein [Streptococcus pneumoniae]